MTENNKTAMGLLDTLIILLLACTLVLFYVWLGGVFRGKAFIETLPGFVREAYAHVWSYLTGGAVGSAVLVLIQGRRKGPNYLLWSFATSLAVLVPALALVRIIPPPVPHPPAMLKFTLVGQQGAGPALVFFQKYPKFVEAHTIAPEADGHYQLPVDVPDQGSPLCASFVERVARGSSAQVSHPDLATKLSFDRLNSPANNPPWEIRLACIVGQSCKFTDTDPGWVSAVSPCPIADAEQAGGFNLVPTLDAEASEPQTAQPGWRVPSLDSLHKMTDRERSGYTEFSIKSEQLKGLTQANSFRYLIKANGSPLYIDGWSPGDMLKSFSATQGLDFSFGLENLSFSGADKGCEKIEVSFDFRDNERIVKRETISRQYAALRDAYPEDVKSEDGTEFTWGGTYIKAPIEDKLEVFIASPSNLGEAMALKARIDAAGHTFQGQGVVGVLRPPLDNPHYGVVVGLVQPTGQIRFTFEPQLEQAILKWAKAVFRPDAFPYQMKRGDSGVGKLKSCNE